MEDLFRAGGLLAVLNQVSDLLDPEPITVTGRPLIDYLAGQPDLGRGRDQAPGRRRCSTTPVSPSCGATSPRAARSVKPAAASPDLLVHRGRAVVFNSVEDLRERIDDPDLDVDADSVLVLRGCGPKGYPGMPEVANLPLPRKLLRAGRARHGPHLRRPDERDRLRHRRAARGAGGGRRRAARAWSRTAT